MKRWVIERGALVGSLCLVACGPTSTDDDGEATASDLAALATSNVEQALREVQPWGVDVSSGVEAAPGQKDLGKVREFIQRCRKV